jgi:hypothetical protein
MDKILAAMLAGRDELALPPAASFAPLEPSATNVPCVSKDVFSTHTTYCVPIDNLGLGPSPPLANVIHRFSLRRCIALPLNEELGDWAEAKEQVYRRECEAGEISCDVRPAGARLSNYGGFQSYHNLFDDSSTDQCLALRHYISLAMDELGQESSIAMYPPAEDIWAVVPGASLRLTAGRPAPNEPHASYAWVNVNKTSHSNVVRRLALPHTHRRRAPLTLGMSSAWESSASRNYASQLHTHVDDRWSAVYYVSEVR